ncbi:hypothetical protein BGZ54_004946, partial [Gamsiella multidivaricata]
MGIKDLFANLFKSIARVIHLHFVDIEFINTTVTGRFSDLRQRLLSLPSNTPFQKFNYKILLV